MRRRREEWDSFEKSNNPTLTRWGTKRPNNSCSATLVMLPRCFGNALVLFVTHVVHIVDLELYTNSYQQHRRQFNLYLSSARCLACDFQILNVFIYCCCIYALLIIYLSSFGGRSIVWTRAYNRASRESTGSSDAFEIKTPQLRDAVARVLSLRPALLEELWTCRPCPCLPCRPCQACRSCRPCRPCFQSQTACLPCHPCRPCQRILGLTKSVTHTIETRI